MIANSTKQVASNNSSHCSFLAREVTCQVTNLNEPQTHPPITQPKPDMQHTSSLWKLIGVTILFVATFSLARAQPPETSPSLRMSLSDADRERLEWTDGDELRVVSFLGVECPVARFYASRINEIALQYADQRVRFVGINSNLHDSTADVKRFASELGLRFPQIKDTDQHLARAFSATRTAEVIVMQHDHIIYRGRVDDQSTPGVKRSKATSNELGDAIANSLAGAQVAIPRTEPVGCLITFDQSQLHQSRVESPSVTFCKQVAPILYEHCYECHRPKEIGPFDVSDYAELRGWADMVVEVIEQKRMPPWHASDSEFAFKNARHLPAESIALIKQWAKEGAAFGDPKDLPQRPQYEDGWRLPSRPDLVVSMRDRPYTIAASGAIDYQYFVVDPKLTEDRWVSAAQVIPGNPSVVHHAIVFVRPPDGIDSQGVGWLTAFVPGQRATTFPAGYARRVPAGSKFVFQMHYTPNGVEQLDTTKIGINFMDADRVTHEVFTLVGLDQEFEIPPHVSNHQVSMPIARLPRDAELLAIMPHMHLRGKSFRLTASVQSTDDALVKPSEPATILDVPRYDFNWQHTYELEVPIPLNSLRQLSATVAFDNSNSNPSNPNPDEYVLWGDQTWEEMAVAFLEVAKPLLVAETSTTASQESNAMQPIDDSAATASDAPNADTKAVTFADRTLAKFDRNRDEKLSPDEVTQIMRDYSFARIDTNRDGVLTRDEIIAASRNSRD
jgi:peroxiredoxin